MDARAILAKLRRHEAPSEAELRWFSNGLADGHISDAQAGAFAMAVCMGQLGEAARVALTLGMRDSGDVLDWDLPGPVIDKHSTGGVGDCISLLLAPALAECGGFVPMISGRGLGHTGGTLDKIESIPGVSTAVAQESLGEIVARVGCAIVGATARIAPADKRLYAIRDVTGTVESLDLITASILSKKLAASPQALVLDVKVGSGAFMKTMEDARALARALTTAANAAGCRTTAVITDMNQPLAPALGNALEVAEVMKALTGETEGPLVQLSAALGGVLLADAGLADDVQAGADSIAATIRDGRAAERFGRMVAALGGPVAFLDDWRRFLPEADVIREVIAPADGNVAAIDGEALGLTVVDLGGGRQVESDVVDPSVGLSGLVRLGQQVAKGQTIAVVHAAREDAALAAERAVLNAIALGHAPGAVPDLIHERID
ncbi:thymidine phosphorylase [Sedimentitalea sp. JM2-8]|uniref:Thymidine phosphorylase n=1 Tax=Sedimentitalea xiamensis TaxID=3050037 RepID=A0ABT7FIB4_9RHOB|nr:thymidine phosphorylase [Sedimentitalea xiamensis]MDK3074856.1 thymidine phosphorylase [Sedimentitalea xiamensis]